MSSQLTLTAPRLGAEEGVGRTTKKNEHEKPTVPCLCLAARLPRPWPRTEWGGSAGRKKSKQTSKRDNPGPSTERGVGRTRKNIKRTNQAAQPNHARDTPNPDIKIPKHLKEPKEKDEDLKMQKAPGNTQRGNADPKRRKGRKQPKEYTQIPTRRRYQK